MDTLCQSHPWVRQAAVDVVDSMPLQFLGQSGLKCLKMLEKVSTLLSFPLSCFIWSSAFRSCTYSWYCLGITEVQIIQWYVEEGAHVEEWKPLCQYQSDKAVDDVWVLPLIQGAGMLTSCYRLRQDTKVSSKSCIFRRTTQFRLARYGTIQMPVYDLFFILLFLLGSLWYRCWGR